MSEAQDDIYLDMAAVRRSTSLGQSTIYRLIGQGTFPKPFNLSPGRVA